MSFAPSRKRLLLACAWLWLGLSVQAADWPVPRGPSREPAPYRYDPAVLKQAPKEFLEDAPACVVYSGMNYLIEADGTLETVIHDITRFNGRKGIDRLGEYRSIFYNPAYQKLTLHEARVHKTDERIVPIEPRHLQLRDLTTDYLVYDRDKQLVISFPNLEVGDVIEVKWTTRGKNPEHQGQFFQRYTFGSDSYPVLLDELRVRLPKARTFHHAAIGGKLEPTVKKEGAFRLHHWQVRNRPALPQYDDMPSREDLRLQVALSTFGSWDDVQRWKEKLRADCWECTPEIRQVVEEVTRGLQTPREKARALTGWLRRNVRYVSAGESHDFTPHRPVAVLANRFGDCKDQSQLLAVMLREAGIPVALVTIGARGDGQVLPDVPSPWGTHAILLATIEGREHWIDTTVNLAGWDFLPLGDRDRACYVIPVPSSKPGPLGTGPGDKIRLARTPGLTPESNRYDQTTHVHIAADGFSRCERTTIYHGLTALNRRDDWLEAPPGERRRLVTSELQDANSRTRLRQLTLDEKQLANLDQPVTARAVFEIAGHFTGESAGGDREGSITDSKVWGKLLAYNLDHDRSVALDLGAPFESRHRYVLHLPPAYRLEGTPRPRTLRSKWGFFTVTTHADPDQPRRLQVEFHTRLERARIEPADFDEFRRFHEDVSKHYRVWLTLKPARDLDDTAALELFRTLTPEDATSALVLARLYEQNGLAADARRVLRQALQHQPADAALLEQLVKSAESLEEEEAAHRELVRRFPDEPRHAVNLGSTLVNRGDHAQARAVLQPVADKGPPARRAQAHFQLARSSFQENKADRALLHLEAARLADPETAHNLRSWMLRGRALEKLNHSFQAMDAYREALKIDADAPETLGALVQLLVVGGDREEALRHLRRYVLVVGNDPMGLVWAADWNLRLGRYDEAFDLASRARDIRFHEKAQRVLGLVYAHRGDLAKTVFHLEKAQPDGQVLEALIRGYLALGQLREAEDSADKASRYHALPPELRRLVDLTASLVQRRRGIIHQLELNPSREGVVRTVDLFVCAEHGHSHGMPADRIEALLDVVAMGEVELAPAFGLRGLLALEKGKLSRALADAERALMLSPEEVSGHYVRGRVRLERGTDGALADLTRAAELGQRKDPIVLHWLATALFRAGRSQEAVTTQRQAVQLKPLDLELREQLRELEKAGKQGGSQP